MGGIPDLIRKKITSAKASFGGTPIRDGRGVLIIEKLEMGDKTNGFCGICEFRVESSEHLGNAAEVEPGVFKDVQPNAPGSFCSWVVNFTKSQSAGGNYKSFVLALLGADEDAVSDAELDEAIVALNNEDPLAKDSKGQPLDVNPARGRVIRYETFRTRQVKDKSKMFMGMNWKHVPCTAEQIVANRAKLDALAKAQPKPAE